MNPNINPTDELLPISQAEGYVQLLMQEGKLEDKIVLETAQVFQLDKAAVRKLIKDYRTNKKEYYKKNVSSNLIEKFSLFLFIILLGAFYLFISLQAKTFGIIFWPLVILMGFAALGMLGYCFALLGERYNWFSKDKAADASWKSVAENKKTRDSVLAFGIIFTGMLCFTSYNYFKKKYMLLDQNLVETVPVILAENCIKKHKSGKSGYWYYQLNVKGSRATYWWRAQDHNYAFSRISFPDETLRKGDTISLYLDKSTVSRTDDIMFICDVKKNNRRLLNLSERNKRAEASARKSFWILFGVEGLFLLIVIGKGLYGSHKPF